MVREHILHVSLLGFDLKSQAGLSIRSDTEAAGISSSFFTTAMGFHSWK
jgi:hypothetical protein